MIESKEVFRIINRQTGDHQGVYSRACHDEYNFSSVSGARHANVHGIYENEKLYKIARYKVTYTLIEDDC